MESNAQQDVVASRPIIGEVFQEVSRIRRNWTPQQTMEYIRDLPIWNGTPEVVQKFGGLQNRTFFAKEPDGKQYAVRVGFDQFRTRQSTVVNCTIAAHKLGLGPRLVYAEPNLTVVEFVEGRQMTLEEMRDPKVIEQIIDRMKILHEGAHAIEETISYWWPFDSVRRYLHWMETGKKETGYQPSKWVHLVPQFREVTDKLEKVIAPFIPKFTHNDMLCVNMMFNKQNEILFIDWDGGAYGHPMWDLGEMLMWVEADDEMIHRAIERYYGKLGKEELAQRAREVRAFQIMAAVRMCTECMEHVLVPYYFLTPEEVSEGLKLNLPGHEPSFEGLIELILPRFHAFWELYKDQF